MLALSEWESWRGVARSFPRARNTTGALNTASGVHALVSNTTGYNNTADGAGALAFKMPFGTPMLVCS